MADEVFTPVSYTHLVIILDGVSIGSHVVIGAGTLITKDVPDYSIVLRCV